MATQNHLSLVRNASINDVAMVCNVLADGGVPSAIWGVNATAQYGGQQLPLVRITRGGF